MKIKLEKEDVEILEKAEKIVGYGDREGEYTTLDNLLNVIDNLLYEVHRLEEKVEDTESYYQDNYQPVSPYKMYGVSESEFH